MNVLEQVYSIARKHPGRVIFPEGSNEKIMRAAYETATEGYIRPILLGNREELRILCKERGYDENIFMIQDLSDEEYKEDLIRRYLELPECTLSEKAVRRKINDPLSFGLIMEAAGDGDVTFAGIDYSTGDVLLKGQMFIGLKEGQKGISSIALCEIPGFETSEGNLLALSDCAVAVNPDCEELSAIAIEACDTMHALMGWQPRCAMISYSTLGSGTGELVEKVRKAVMIANEKRPDLAIEGEFQLDAAIVPEVAAKKVKTESKVAGRANILVWPDLNVGNVAVKLIQNFGKADAYGPMLQGFRKIVCDCSRGAPVSELKGNIIIAAARAAGE